MGIGTNGAGKYLKPYQGLKPGPTSSPQLILGRKIPKTLSGIETKNCSSAGLGIAISIGAGKYLKPYQGLKLELNDRTFLNPGKPENT